MLRALFPQVITFDGKVLTFMQFVKRYCIYENTDHGIKIVRNRDENIGELKKRMAAIMLRRSSTILGNQRLPDEVLYLDANGLLKELQKQVRDAVTEDQRLALEKARTPEALDRVLQRVEDSVKARLQKITGLAKAPALVERLKDELESGLEKVVVFGWHTEVLDFIAEALAGYGAIVSHGKVPAAQRDANALRFQSDETCRVICANIKAEGVGRDFSAACELIFVETSWVPGDNDQAAMRIMGVNQKRAARVRYAVLPGSIDERLTEVNRRKAKDIAALYDGADLLA
jgi:SNF2 family DNA or RNA helicase